MDISALTSQFSQSISDAQSLLDKRGKSLGSVSNSSSTSDSGDTGAAAASGGSFGTALDSALRSVSATQQNAQSLEQRFQMEDPSVSLEQTMTALNQSQISFQGAVQVRNKVLQAYESIMQMQI